MDDKDRTGSGQTATEVLTEQQIKERAKKLEDDLNSFIGSLPANVTVNIDVLPREMIGYASRPIIQLKLSREI